jgi:hypothetical protein
VWLPKHPVNRAKYWRYFVDAGKRSRHFRARQVAEKLMKSGAAVEERRFSAA